MKIDCKTTWLGMTSLLGQYKFANSNSSQSYSQVRVIDDLEQCGAVDKAKILFVIEKSEELSSTSSIPIAAHPHAKFRATILAWISVCLAMLAGASIGPVSCFFLFFLTKTENSSRTGVQIYASSSYFALFISIMAMSMYDLFPGSYGYSRVPLPIQESRMVRNQTWITLPNHRTYNI